MTTYTIHSIHELINALEPHLGEGGDTDNLAHLLRDQCDGYPLTVTIDGDDVTVQGSNDAAPITVTASEWDRAAYGE